VEQLLAEGRFDCFWDFCSRASVSRGSIRLIEREEFVEQMK
jgi:hypothetical protein